MTDFDAADEGLVQRLQALGTHSIDPATQSQHLTAMAEAAASAPTLLGLLRRRAGIALAFGAGLLLGTTGLATAGALGPLQPIAHTVVGAVTPLDVPNGHANSHASANANDDSHGVQRFTDGCEAGVSTRNRGQYLKGIREKFGEDSPQMVTAKASRCGMPIQSAGTPGTDDTSDANKADDNGKDDEVHGKSDEQHGKSDQDHGKANANSSDNEGKSDEAPGKCAGGAEVTAGDGQPACAAGDQPTTPGTDNATSGSDNGSDHESSHGEGHSGS